VLEGVAHGQGVAQLLPEQNHVQALLYRIIKPVFHEGRKHFDVVRDTISAVCYRSLAAVKHRRSWSRMLRAKLIRDYMTRLRTYRWCGWSR
jgi:hypothetical protein